MFVDFLRGRSTYSKLIGSSWCACMLNHVPQARLFTECGAGVCCSIYTGHTLQFLERGDLTVGLVSFPDPTPPQGKRVW